MKAYDADLIEYHAKTRMPVGLLEMKHGEISSIDLMSDEIRCLRNTANKLEIPLLVVVYYF